VEDREGRRKWREREKGYDVRENEVRVRDTIYVGVERLRARENAAWWGGTMGRGTDIG
jgi:hypothetical protein